MTVPRTRHAVQALLAAHGLGPRRTRGQNFLVDGNMIDAIVRDAGVERRHAVLEIGTGTGILTDSLADRAGALVSCDIDTRLQELTRGLRTWPEGVQFIGEDILQGKHALNQSILDAWCSSGLTLKKGLGQNFLVNQGALQKLRIAPATLPVAERSFALQSLCAYQQ